MINLIKEGKKQIADQKGIRENFKKYYQKLYKERTIDRAEIKNYLEKVSKSKIEDYIMKGLNDPIEVEKIEMAIKQTNLGKMQGTDGISAKLYKL